VILELRDVGDAVPPKVLTDRTYGVRADREGIQVEGSIIRIPWRDLEGVDFQVEYGGGVGNTRAVLVTHHYGRFRLVGPTGSPTPGDKQYEIAQTLLAMRDAYTSEPRESSVSPSDTNTPSDLAAPRTSVPRPETAPTPDVDHATRLPLPLSNTDAGAQPPAPLVKRSNEMSGLGLWIPIGVAFGWGAVASGVNGYILGSLFCFALALLACGLVFSVLRFRLRADQDGIDLRSDFRSHRIAWPDLERIEFEKVPAEEGRSSGLWLMVFVTRDQRGIPDRSSLTNGGAPKRELVKLANTLLAMRDYYAPPTRPEPLGPGQT
jgi:hypothetical protein